MLHQISNIDTWDWNNWYVHIFKRRPVLILDVVSPSKFWRLFWWFVFFSLL